MGLAADHWSIEAMGIGAGMTGLFGFGVQHAKVAIFYARRRTCNVHTFRASYAITLG